ncbi:MAG TPA: helix-turn-helix domain-containing protein [Acidimicrobiia bacterium]|nr:helix-turn-helix domain-containing protein [Acidimicrobiia bacterium]
MNEHELPPKRRGGADDHLMTIEEVGAYLQVPVKTLYDWRHKGCGPRGMRVGRYVRYRRSEVDAWLDSCRDPEPPVAVGSRRAS